jgi:hypothetical protein
LWGSLQSEENTIHNIIASLDRIGKEKLIGGIRNLHPFETYLIDYFYSGIETKKE